MEDGVPYVTAALFCERVIEGKDGVLSAIRIIDRVEVGIESDVPSIREQLKKVKPAARVTGLISLKSGPVKGVFTLNIFGEKPSGQRMQLSSFPVELKGGDSGQNFVIDTIIPVEEEGLHWFDVMFDDHLLTKIPITLSLARIQEERSAESQH